MTAWQSMFDGGECTVKVSPQNFSGGFDAPMWSGALGKGDTSPAFIDTLTNESGATVSVNAEGVVVLTIPVDNGYIYAVDVVPSYDVSSYGIRAVAIAAYVKGTTGLASNLAATAPVVVTFDQDSVPPAIVPNTALLTGAGQVGCRVANGNGSIG